jgi:protein O-mannosyl-transferase
MALHNMSGDMTTPDRPHLFTRPGFILLLLFVLATAVYLNSFSVPFQFDDKDNIIDNPFIKQLDNFLNPSTFLYGSRVVGFLTFGLNYRFGGLSVFGYHLVNLLIHLINGGLVFLLVRLLFHTPRLSIESAPAPQAPTTSPTTSSPTTSSWIALSTAALFLVHPIQTEAVTYIIQRLASLAALFYLLTVVCYLRWRVSPAGRRRWLWYGAALITTVLAMKTKENTFTLPFMLLLVELVFFGLPSRRGWLGLLPFFLTLPIIPLARPGDIGEGGEAGFASATADISRLDYLITQFRVIITYLRLLVLPIQQNLDYDYPVYHSLFQLPVFVSFLALLGLGGTALWLLLRSGPVLSARSARSLIRGERPDSPRPPHGHTPFSPSASRLAAFGVFWFFLTLSVESSIIPIPDVMNEHRLYLPGIGLFLAASALLFGAAERRRLWNVAAVAVGLVVLVLAIATYERNTIWQSATALWQDVVRKSPNKARGYNSLGIAYKELGNWHAALTNYETALALDPNNLRTHFNLGNAYHALGRNNESINEYQAAITLAPDYAEAHNNLGIVYEEQGELERAVREYQTAITLKPYLADAHNNLGIAYQKLGRPENAVREYQTAVRLDPAFAEAYHNLGIMYKNAGRLEEAARYYARAVALTPDDTELHYHLGGIDRDLGRLDEASRHYQAAIRLKPDFSDAYTNLGFVYFMQKKYSESQHAFEKGIQLNPNDAQAHNILGLVYANLGRPAEAIQAYQTAIRLKPDYAGAYVNLGVVYLKQGTPSDALGAFDTALQLNPNAPLIHNLMGITLERLGRLDDAIRHFQTAVKLKPDFTEAYSHLGELYRQTGQTPHAIAAYKKVLQMQPNDENARRALTALGR